jgi:hypothetical protein
MLDVKVVEANQLVPSNDFLPAVRQMYSWMNFLMFSHSYLCRNSTRYKQQSESVERFDRICIYQDKLFQLFKPSAFNPVVTLDQIMSLFNEMKKHSFLKHHKVIHQLSQVPKHLVSRLSSTERGSGRGSGHGSGYSPPPLRVLSRLPSVVEIEAEFDGQENLTSNDVSRFDYVQRIYGKDSEVIGNVQGALDSTGDQVYGEEKDDIGNDAMVRILDLIHLCDREPFQAKGNPWDYWGFDLIVHVVTSHEYSEDNSPEKGPVTQYSYCRLFCTSERFEFQEQLLYSEYVSTFPWGTTRHSFKRKATISRPNSPTSMTTTTP